MHIHKLNTRMNKFPYKCLHLLLSVHIVIVPDACFSLKKNGRKLSISQLEYFHSYNCFGVYRISHIVYVFFYFICKNRISYASFHLPEGAEVREGVAVH